MLLIKSLVLFVAFWSQPPTTSQPTDDLLAEPYLDGTCGFSIQPPKGWYLIRQRVPEQGSITLLRMIGRMGTTQTEEIAIKQTSTKLATSMGEVLKKRHQDWVLVRNGLDVVALQEQEIANRPGGLLIATYENEGLKWFMIEAIIQQSPREYFVLLYNGPLPNRQTSEPLFHLVLSSFRMLSSHLSEADLAEAMEAGAKFLTDLNKDRLLKAMEPDQIFRLDMDGKPMGFVRIWQTLTDYKRIPGIRFQEMGWMFETEGVVRRMITSIFLSDDMQTENWKNKVTMLLPARKDTLAMLDGMLEEGVRDRKVLLTSQESRLGQGINENPAVTIPKAYISRGLLRLLPRVLGNLAQPRRLAFAEFDYQRAGMIVRVVDIKGPVQVPNLPIKGQAYLIVQREGIADQVSEWYVDETGKILLIKTGKLIMKPATEKELETLFEKKVAQADEEIGRLEKQFEERQEQFGPKRKPKPLIEPSKKETPPNHR